MGGVLVPLSIFVTGLVISNAEKENANSSLQAERLTEMIEHLSSANPKQQLIATEVAAFLATKEQLPSELVPTLTRIAMQSNSSETALAATQAIVVAAEKNASTEKAVRSAFTRTPPRVYFHIPRRRQMDAAKKVAHELKSDLSRLNITVPGIEVKAGPAKTELRFFRSGERDEAEKILAALLKRNVEVELADLSSRFETSKGIRSRHYELWFGNKN